MISEQSWLAHNNGPTTPGMNMMHLNLQGRGRPDNNATAWRSLESGKPRPTPELKYATSNTTLTSGNASNGQAHVFSLDGLIPYSTLALNSRSGTAIHLQSLSTRFLFTLKGTNLPGETAYSTWTTQIVRMLLVHRPCTQTWATAEDYLTQLFDHAAGSTVSVSDAMGLNYNAANAGNFRVLEDKWVTLCPVATAAPTDSTTSYKPYYSPAYVMSLEQNISLGGMVSRYPDIAAGSATNAYIGGLHYVFVFRNQDVGTEARTSINFTTRIGFVDA